MAENKYNIPDLDLDISSKSREDILHNIHNIPASKINLTGINPHGVGVYFCNIPEDKLTHLASIDYKNAENEYGYIKVDLLHNTIYDEFETRTDMISCLNKNPNWNLLYNNNVVEKLPHINNYYTLINQLPKIDTVEKLAMLLAIIRPGKKYLIKNVMDNGWDSILDKIWIKENTGYMYKKSHAIAFALSIILEMNKIGQ